MNALDKAIQATEDKGYNGWTNRETWGVALMLDNDKGSNDYWRSIAHYCFVIALDGHPHHCWTIREHARYTLSEMIKDEIESGNPLEDRCDVYSDLLGCAMCEVNWDEIARHYLDDIEWFDCHGNIEFDIPKECVSDCSASGDVTDAVEYWQDQLGFEVPTKRKAIMYLKEFGAWPIETNDYDKGLVDMTSKELSQKVLWLACCDLKENGEYFGMIH